MEGEALGPQGGWVHGVWAVGRSGGLLVDSFGLVSGIRVEEEVCWVLLLLQFLAQFLHTVHRKVVSVGSVRKEN
ncbi:MAG: hypothetical protein Harvfovirus7_15 [Harvfovirus sp.]|uniref:Uncharacterized protein n=1 Tax=Harvfovirus sp. TaxID=2487768 RepID=A0A3G5A0U4_9VIRU|nr:MAG: hypothetical protein Harvfovirus7_15 [Harvfovirus sp.]